MDLKKLVPINDSLEKLVWGTCEPVTALLEQGTLPARWSARYFQLLTAAERCLFASDIWPKRLFSSLHFASCYLPLRYEVWIAAGNRRSLQTQQELGEISRTTEILFWNTLLEHRCFIAFEAFTGEQKRLFDLALGDGCPLHISNNPDGLKDWRAELISCLQQLERTSGDSADWPAWILITIHFISFYLDLALKKRIRQSHELHSDFQSQPQIDHVCKRLSEQFPCHSLVLLIRLWLESTHCSRDASGLPVVESLPTQRVSTVSPRTVCEVLLFQPDRT
ncbi:hypothetical protein [Gimesia algae]|uniref:Uncharacterized protein n=1 Tax=Gimesia algae TaxID=2527971 RepID=A0A517VJW1_9PLAN|nr:hypothetical protein [Gimesia algae]QDT93298.1 hypothetical protein Pan161_49770 [Gimesia algae]